MPFQPASLGMNHDPMYSVGVKTKIKISEMQQHRGDLACHMLLVSFVMCCHIKMSHNMI